VMPRIGGISFRVELDVGSELCLYSLHRVR
jgi:hypothetical protein